MNNWITLTLEILSFILALWQNHLLAHKKRSAWFVNFIFSIFTVVLFAMKFSYITVINQTYLWIVSLYPWFYWGRQEKHMQNYIRKSSWIILMMSMYFFRYNNFGDYFEIASWYCIYMKHNLTRTDNATGWIYMIWQKILTVIFNILRMNYILALRNFLQLWQAIYGYKKWKTPIEFPTE